MIPVKMYKEFTIYKKGLTLIAIPLFVQAIFIAVLVRSQAESERARDWAVHTKIVIAKIEEIRVTFVEGLFGVRGLIFGHDSSAALTVHRAVTRLPEQLDLLRSLVADNVSQSPRLRSLELESKTMLAWLTGQQTLVNEGRKLEAEAKIDEGANLLASVRATIDQILAEEYRLDTERMEILAHSARRQAWILIAGGAATFITIFILAILFLQGIVNRLAVLRDNTRRMADAQRLNDPLDGHDEIAEVDRAFHDMADNLNQQKQENEMFVYSVSHDLRSPLVNLQGFSEELSLSCGDLRLLFERDDVPEVVRQRGLGLVNRDIGESIRFIQAAVGRLARIIDALLRLSRAGRVEYRWQTVDVDTVVRRVTDALHDTLSSRNVRIDLHPLPPAWGDPVAIEQIFGNLVGNAVQYLDPARPARIEVGCRDDRALGKPAALQVYYVKDNGLGIDEAYHSRMFTAFNRLHADVSGGEGIGLALVRRIVERHGGRIWFESKAGVGSTFFVALMPNSTDGSTADAPAGTRETPESRE
jgi:signal transduction histidine kinase